MTIWKKTWRDLYGNKFRSLLAVLSIAAGLFALGLAFGAYGVMLSRLEADKRITHPAHLVYTHPDGFFSDLVAAAQKRTGIAAVEGEVHLPIRWRLSGESAWQNGVIVARGEYTNQSINIVSKLSGDWPTRRTLAVERKTAAFYQIPKGMEIAFETGASEKRLPIVGTLRKPYILPADYGGPAHFYTTLETAAWLTGVEGFNRLRVILESPEAEPAFQQWVGEQGFNIAGSSAAGLTDEFNFNDIPIILLALFLILIVMGLLALGMSILIITNTISAHISQELWQIGVMKVLGATAWRVSRVYLSTALIYGVLASSLAVPPGIISAHLLANWLLDIMGNIPPSGSPQPAVLGVGIQVIAGVGAPILAALSPVLAGTRTGIQQTLATYGLGGNFGSSWWDRIIGQLRFLSRPMMLSLRNAFRRKTRMRLTLLSLSAAGVMFVAVLSTQRALVHTIDLMGDSFRYDILIILTRPYRAEELYAITQQVPGVTTAEVWIQRSIPMKIGETDVELSIYGVPPNSSLFIPRLSSGRALETPDGKAILISSNIAEKHHLLPGDQVTLTINKQTSTWTIIGLAGSIRPGGGDSFVPFEALAQELGQSGAGDVLVVGGSDHSLAGQVKLREKLSAVFARQGIKTITYQSEKEFREQSESVFTVIIGLLMVMVLLSTVVGGISIAGTMAMNTIERRREIAVMRAVGAASRDIAWLLVGEAALVGLMSWCIAIPVSLVAARWFASTLGKLMFSTPLAFQYAPLDAVAWLGLVLVISIAASLGPAWKAAKSSVQEIITYE